MQSLKASIYLKGEIILRDIDVWLTGRSDVRGYIEWTGTFDLPHSQSPANRQLMNITERYFIELEDGRACDIVLLKVTGGLRPSVSFRADLEG